VIATELPGCERHIYAATYGEPPDPPATAALLAAATTAFTQPARTCPRSAATHSSGTPSSDGAQERAAD